MLNNTCQCWTTLVHFWKIKLWTSVVQHWGWNSLSNLRCASSLRIFKRIVTWNGSLTNKSKHQKIFFSDLHVRIKRSTIEDTNVDTNVDTFTEDGYTTESFLEVIKERAAKLNLSTELLNALEHHSARKSDSDAGNDVTAFLTSLLGSFLPVFDTSAINNDKPSDNTKNGYRKPYKIVEVENPDQIVPLEVKTGYSQVQDNS